MARALTSRGRCPNCNERVAKVDSKNSQRVFYKVKSLLINEKNGEVVATCSNCKIELEMPVIKMPRKVRKEDHVAN